MVSGPPAKHDLGKCLTAGLRNCKCETLGQVCCIEDPHVHTQGAPLILNCKDGDSICYSGKLQNQVLKNGNCFLC